MTTVDVEPWFEPTIVADIRKLKWSDLPPSPDIVLASPPCEGFSIAAVRWNYRDGVPYGWKAKEGIELVHHTLRLLRDLNPKFFLIENPRGMLGKLDLIPYEKRLTTMCRYGGPRMKPTHLWGGFPPSLRLKPPCKQGDWCHPAHPRSTYQPHSIQTVPKWQRALIPRELSLAACRAAERDLSE